MFRPRATKRAGPKDGLDPCGKPYTLAELGLFIDEDDSVRIIAQPTERYQYKMKRADRDLKSSDAEDYNDRFWLATSNALSIIVCERLERYGLIRQLVPLGSSADDPHTCIYTSPHDLARPELTVIFTDGGELGVWTGRLVSQRSVRCGSLEYFVHLLVQDGRDIIIANPTQIIWNAELKVAMTRHQFICSGGRRLGKATQIPQMKTQAEHVNYVMHSVVAQSMSTKISIVAAGFSALALIQYLDEYWSMWQGKLSAIAFLSSCHSREDISNESLQSFMTLVRTSHNVKYVLIVEMRQFLCVRFGPSHCLGGRSFWSTVCLRWPRDA